MTSSRRAGRLTAFAIAVGIAAHGAAALADETDRRTLRVCSDPNNMPFSNDEERGFENRIAELIAAELDAALAYTWWAQRRGFIRNTLNAGDCDLVMGIPAGDEMVETTRPYYRSTYVFVHRTELGAPLHSIFDPRLNELSIGVHLTGDDGANPPPVHALGQLGVIDNVSGYMIYGDYRESDPPSRLIHAVAGGEIDVAAVWGPLGGYFASRADPRLVAHPITDVEPFPWPFEFSIAMGVRKGDAALREEVQAALDRRSDEIRQVLLDYDVPLVVRDEE